MVESKASIHPDERVWYDQFTSTDWVHDSIADAYRVKALRSRKDFWGRVYVLFDGAQGWILSAVVGVMVAILAYVIDISEQTVFDFKDGYCAKAWYLSERVWNQPPCSRICICMVANISWTEMLSSRGMHRLERLGRGPSGQFIRRGMDRMGCLHLLRGRILCSCVSPDPPHQDDCPISISTVDF